MGQQRNPEIVVQLLTIKVREAEKEQKTVTEKYLRSKRLLDNVIGQKSAAAMVFKPVLKEVLEGRWTISKLKNKEKVDFLVKKYRPKIPDEIKGIAISDKALAPHLKPLEEPLVWGEAASKPVLSEAAVQVMRLPPKTTVFPSVDVVKVEMEVEKMLVKLRWEAEKQDPAHQGPARGGPQIWEGETPGESGCGPSNTGDQPIQDETHSLPHL